MSLKYQAALQPCVDNSSSHSSSIHPQHVKHEFYMHAKEGRMIVEGLGNSDWKIKGRMDAFGGKAIIHENHKVLGVIICERKGRHFSYKLLSTNPRYPSQKAHSFRIKDQQFYEHMTIQRTSFFSNNFVIRGPSDKDEIKYVVRESSSRFGPLKLKVYEKDNSARCCGAVRQFFDHGDVCSSSWKVQSDKDLNPKIMVCLTAIVSKSLSTLYTGGV